MASLNISGDLCDRSYDDADNSMSSVNPQDISANLHDISANPQDISANLYDISVNPQDIDVVYLDGEGSKLCLATFNHQGQDVTGCGNGNCKDSAKDDAIKNLMSNLSILYPSLHSM